MKKTLFLAFAAIGMFAACQKTEVSQESQNGPLQSILVNVESFGSDNGTKTAVAPAGTFTWSAGDQIGIYPVASTLGAEQTSQQIVFKINGDVDASSIGNRCSWILLI